MSWLKWRWLRLRARMMREKQPPSFIARGWAIGMFFGCTIPFGFQLILSIPAAIVLKGSKVGATVGTFITNHFTIFVIYPAQCWVGNKVLELFGRDVMSVEKIVADLKHVGGLSMFSGEEEWTMVAKGSCMGIDFNRLGSKRMASAFLPTSSVPSASSLPKALAPPIVAIRTTCRALMTVASCKTPFCNKAASLIASSMSVALLLAAPSVPRHTFTPASAQAGMGAMPEPR